MESVSPHARLRVAARQGEHLGVLGLAAVERRIETGDLRYVRSCRSHRRDCGKVVRLMQRGKRRQRLKHIDDFGVDPDRR
jgi:hypothetical protein